MKRYAIDRLHLPGREGSHRLTVADGRVDGIEPCGSGAEGAFLALPALVNFHAHLDRAFTATAQRPASVMDAVRLSSSARAAFTPQDVRRRAGRLLAASLAHGVTRIRTHTDVDPLVEMRSIEGVLQAREDFAGRVDVEIIAFSTSRNSLTDADGAARIRAAVAAGASVIGASLNPDDEPRQALRRLAGLADALGLPLDLHLDEHLTPSASATGAFIEAVEATGLQGRASLSHGCVLSVMEKDEARRIIERLAAARIAVVAMPEANLFLQDRGAGTPRARGITLVHELRAAGVAVRLGTDNVRDWFYPFGDGDMLDTALFGAVAAHLDTPGDLLATICDGRSGVAVGDPADLVLVPARSLDEALAVRPAGRVVIRAGDVVSGVLP